MKIETWSASTLSKSQACLRLLKYEKIDWFVSREISSASVQGILTHAGLLESYIASVMKGNTEGLMPPDAEISSKAKELETKHQITISPYDMAKAMVYTETGFAYLTESGFLDGKEIISVESKFEVTLRGHPFKGFFDVILFDKARNVYQIFELKTTSSEAAISGGKMWWETKLMANQPVIYHEALKKVIGDPNIDIEIVYFVIRSTTGKPKLKPGIRKKKDESKEEYELRKADSIESYDEWFERLMEEYRGNESKFALSPMVFMKSDIENRMSEVTDIIAMVEGQTSFPRNPGNCSSFGGCAFVDVCLGTSTLETDNNLIKLEKSKEEPLPF